MPVFNVGLFASDLPSDGVTDAGPALERWATRPEAATGSLFIPPGRYRIRTPTVLPASANVELMQGALLDVDAGASLRIDGGFNAPFSRVFSGRGAITLEKSRVRAAFPEWWGASPEEPANQASIQAALDSGVGIVQIRAVDFPVTREIVFRRAGQSIVGDSMQSSSISAGAGFSGSAVLRIEGGPHLRVARLKIEGTPSVDCIRIQDSGLLALQDVFVRGGRSGVLLQKGNIQRWNNVYAESCGDGIVVEPTSDDTNGGTFIGIRAYGCARWGIDVRQGASRLGSSYNTWDASAENCANGIRVRGGLYCQYTLYSENQRGDRFDLQGPHWFFLRNTDNDPTTPFFSGPSIGVHGTGSNIYLDAGQAPERTGRHDFARDDSLGGNGIRMWDVTNSSGGERTMTLQFLETHHVGFRATITKRDRTAGLRIAAPRGITLVGDTGVFGAFVDRGCAMLEIMKIAHDTAVLKQT
jgi:hypothetical protein